MTVSQMIINHRGVDKMNTNIRRWYMLTFPKDELGCEINENVTFYDLFEALDNYEDVYDLLGVGDSIIRERAFSKLSIIMDVGYGEIFDQWLRRGG